mgnify:CR=1 FL=1
MLEADGSINFVPELMETVDAFLQIYEERQGGLEGDLERSLVIAYALGVISCDLQAIRKSLGGAPVFGSADPFAIFDECIDNTDGKMRERSKLIEDLLRERGWTDPER